ncbi:hypothetical protein F5X99DRAFT_423445 [Biscogniauxia marginata]|nr:hypothetical protein F5X99DRAFT_423445 [Biscogniauxia marginata]
MVTTTLMDSNGTPTKTLTLDTSPAPFVAILEAGNEVPTTTLAFDYLPTPVVTTLADSKGMPTATLTFNDGFATFVATLTDSNGAPTKTLTLTVAVPPIPTTVPADPISPPTTLSTPSDNPTPTTTVLTDSNGIPIATLTLSDGDPAAPLTTTLTDPYGTPTATIIVIISPTDGPTDPTTGGGDGSGGGGDGGGPITEEFSITEAQYFVGMFASTLIACLISIPIRMIDLNLQQLQPFHALADPPPPPKGGSTSASGASAGDSLCAETGGMFSVAEGLFLGLFGSHRRRRWPVFLSSLLVVGSAVLTPLSADAVLVVLHGSCTRGSESAANCALTLGVSAVPARQTQALLAAMALVAVLALLALRRWTSGVNSNPWSIAGIASLVSNPDVRRILASLPTTEVDRISNSELKRAFEPYVFRLGYFVHEDELRYGIMVSNRKRGLLEGGEIPRRGRNKLWARGGKARQCKLFEIQPFFMLGFVGRGAFLALLCGLLALIAYYNNPRTYHPFEKFMDGESVWVRLLFTAVGVVITFLWGSIFSGVAALSPYQLMARSSQAAQRTILNSPPTNCFSGIWFAFRRRHTLMGIVAFTAILSEFLPILLANVPFGVTQTWQTHMVCTWFSVAIICFMILVLVGTFFVKWPRLPVDVRTIAGAAYCVCDSWLLEGVDRLNMAKKEERDARVNFSGLRYRFGEIVGVSGATRIGVDVVDLDPTDGGGAEAAQAV